MAERGATSSSRAGLAPEVHEHQSLSDPERRYGVRHPAVSPRTYDVGNIPHLTRVSLAPTRTCRILYRCLPRRVWVVGAN